MITEQEKAITIYCWHSDPNNKRSAVYSIEKPENVGEINFINLSAIGWEYYQSMFEKEYFLSPEEMAWYYEV